MLEMNWITAILQLYSQVTDFLRNVIGKRINMRLFDLLTRFHYILNLPRKAVLLVVIIDTLFIKFCTFVRIMEKPDFRILDRA